MISITIRCPEKMYKTINKLYKKSAKLNKDIVSIVKDDNVDTPIIMVKTESGELREFFRGLQNTKIFIKEGYHREVKKCPYQFGNCRGAKCKLFWIENNVGDCVHVWNTVKLGHGK